MILMEVDECFNILMANLYKMRINRHSEFIVLAKQTMGYRCDDNVIILRNIGNAIEITYMEAKGKAKVKLLNKAKSFGKPLLFTGVSNCIPNNAEEIAENIYCIK